MIALFVLAASPVGVWKFDTSTLKIALNPPLKQGMVEVKGAKETEKFVLDLTTSLRKGLKGRKIEFQKGGAVQMLGNKSFVETGSWYAEGKRISAVMDSSSLKLTPTADGKAMIATFTDKDLTATVTLRKAP